MARNVGNVSGPFALNFRNVNEISSHLAARLRESIEFKLAYPFLNRRNQ